MAEIGKVKVMVDLVTMDEQLKEFMDAFESVQNTTPTIVGPKLALLCAKLRVSEKTETLEAMADENLIEILDGLVDQLYVVIFTARTYGLSHLLAPAFKLIHENNMSKLGSDGKPIKDASGKVQKPEGYVPVDLRPLLEDTCDEEYYCYQCKIFNTCLAETCDEDAPCCSIFTLAEEKK